MDTSRDSTRSLVTPTLIGTGLQLLMVIAGHYSPAVAQMFAAGGMAISGIAGVLAALGGRAASLGRRPAAARWRAAFPPSSGFWSRTSSATCRPGARVRHGGLGGHRRDRRADRQGALAPGPPSAPERRGAS